MIYKFLAGSTDEMLGMVQKFLAEQATKQVKNQFLGGVDNFLGTDGAIKAVFWKELPKNLTDAEISNELLRRYQIFQGIEKLETAIEEQAGENVELNSPLGAINSIFDVSFEKPLEHLTQRDWNVDNPFNTADSLVKYLTSLSPVGEVSPKDILANIEKSVQANLKQIPERIESTSGELFEGIELAEVSEAIEATAGGIMGGAVSYALFQALKELLALQGSLNRGEISHLDVAGIVMQTALKSAPKGVAIGLIFGIAIMLFGEVILAPLMPIAAFAGVFMANSLWQAFWQGLDQSQQQELIDLANAAGGNAAQFINQLKLATHKAGD